MKLTVPLPIIVEGKYDKIRLSGMVDAEIVTTDGFGIFNHRETMALIRRLAEPGGVIVLTDSDGAGQLIRSKITSALPAGMVYHVYTPQRVGKERRKKAASKAGFLGVEGIDDETLRELLSPFAGDAPPRRGGITKADLYFLGLTGGENSAAARDRVAAAAGLPAGMNAGALLGAVNLLYTKEAFEALCEGVLEGVRDDSTTD